MIEYVIFCEIQDVFYICATFMRGLLQKIRSDPIYSYDPKGWVDNGQS